MAMGLSTGGAHDGKGHAADPIPPAPAAVGSLRGGRRIALQITKRALPAARCRSPAPMRSARAAAPARAAGGLSFGHGRAGHGRAKPRPSSSFLYHPLSTHGSTAWRGDVIRVTASGGGAPDGNGSAATRLRPLGNLRGAGFDPAWQGDVISVISLPSQAGGAGAKGARAGADNVAFPLFRTKLFPFSFVGAFLHAFPRKLTIF